MPKGAVGMPGVIVPRKTVGEVQRLIEDNEAEVSIELSQGKIRFTLGNVVLTSKLIDGTFPDYGRVIPAEQRQGLIVDKKDFEGRGRPRLDHFERARPRRKTRFVGRQAGAVGDQPGFRQRHRGAGSRVRLRWLSISASTRATCSTSPPRSKAKSPCCASPTPLADAGAGQGKQGRPLRADADAGVITLLSLPGLTGNPSNKNDPIGVYILARKPGGMLCVGVHQ